MRITVLILALAVFSLGWRGAAPPRPGPLKVMAEFPGASLKWIKIAQPEFEREKLDINKYFVKVIEEDNSISVIITGSKGPKELRGDPGPIPGYEVEISKKDMKVIGSNYIR